MSAEKLSISGFIVLYLFAFGLKIREKFKRRGGRHG